MQKRNHTHNTVYICYPKNNERSVLGYKGDTERNHDTG